MKKHVPSFTAKNSRFWSACSCGYSKTQDDTPAGRKYVEEDMAAHCGGDILTRITTNK
jgi:hypothetical protein